MGRLIEQTALAAGDEIAAVVDIDNISDLEKMGKVADVVMDYLEGCREQAVAAAVKYLDLANGLFMEVNPIPVKTALNMMGKEVGPFRLPLYEMTEAHQAALWKLLHEAGVIA